MDTDFLPSARFTKIVFIILVVTAVGFGLYKGSPGLSSAWSDFWNSRAAKITAENTDAFADYRKLDTDKDGLYDWEESLFGTDIQKTDTDGDGKSDYVEFKSASIDGGSINPGPDVAGLPISSDPEGLDDFDPNNLTDSLARDLYTSLSVTKQQSGGTVSDSDNDQLAAIAAKSLQEFAVRTYTAKDISIISGSGVGQKQKFGAAIQDAWDNADVTAQDVQSMLSAIDSDASISSDILAKLPRWKQLIPELLQIPVPSSIATEYIAYINAADHYVSILVAVGYNDTDPARAISALVGLEESFDAFEKANRSFQSKYTTLR